MDTTIYDLIYEIIILIFRYYCIYNIAIYDLSQVKSLA